MAVRHLGPAHTDGDLIVFDQITNVAAVGDLIWPGSFPFIDTFNGGSAEGLSRSLDDLVSWLPPSALVVPGHGSPMSGEDIRSYHTMVRETVAEVRALADQGASLETIIERGLDPKWASWASVLVPHPSGYA